MTKLLFVVILGLFAPRAGAVRRCLDGRAGEVIGRAEEAARRHGVPPLVLLTVGWLETRYGCDPRSNGGWGAPVPRALARAEGAMRAARALTLGYRRCRDWTRAVAHFRCGGCRCRPPVGYSAQYAARVWSRVEARVR